MAIQPGERIENIKRALFNYIASNYSETTIWFQGSNVLDTTGQTEWVWFGIVGSSRQPMRQIRQDSANMGNLVTFLIQAIIYVKPTETITRIDGIRDVVVNLLRRPIIEVTDRIGSTGNVGRLAGKEIQTDIALGIENDLNTHSLTFEFDFIEEFSQEP